MAEAKLTIGSAEDRALVVRAVGHYRQMLERQEKREGVLPSIKDAVAFEIQQVRAFLARI